MKGFMRNELESMWKEMDVNCWREYLWILSEIRMETVENVSWYTMTRLGFELAPY